MKIIVVLMLVCCFIHIENTAFSQTAKPIKATDTPQQDTKSHKYTIKSGIVTMQADMTGMKSTSILYFDDYGRKEMTETFGNFGDTKIHEKVIIVHDSVYNIDLVKKTGTKKKLNGASAPGTIDFSTISEKMMQEMGISKSGTDSVLQKQCQVWLMDFKRMKMSGKYWVWNNIPLKSIAEIEGIKVDIQAAKIEENPKLPASTFDIPPGMALEEKQ
ncbi:MAG: hypothetical protein HYZ54_12245 [Ignavibacteriae bacterium]|nr:hypothetical protein [Ignavibacteriota bacterium]